ncbi:class I SAM-dependent methyltransferase [Nonomuraea sp. NPDC050556]|uniref:class I SAM-dependent methyltransferase n=1 Tax=Nonomuraea sp. NPDC050556 TaxID=3364369 RepID=UPI00378E6A14
MSRVLRIYEEVAADYDQVGPAFYEANGRELVNLVGLRAGDRVLDAGCGRGACLFPAADLVGPSGEVIGVDLSPAMVALVGAQAQARTPDGGQGLANVQVVVGDAQAPDFPAGSFDVVVSGFVLRLLPDPLAALRAYAELLRPGGRFGATIYAATFGEGWGEVRRVLSSYIPSKGVEVASPLDPASGLAGLLEGAGFGEVLVVDEPFDIWLADPDEWWRYMWASGYRGMMDGIPAADRERAGVAARAAAERLREPDGRLRLPQQVRYATATR